LAKSHSPDFTIQTGIWVASAGTLLMLATMLLKLPTLFFLFLPMIVIYLGTALLPATVGTMAMSQITDKANGSAVMSFVNMGLATVVALNVGFLPITALTLPLVFFVLCGFMMLVYQLGIKQR
jgi:hypothetical protein